MGIYSEISQSTGQLYDFEIVGQTPTTEEADKIAHYLSTNGAVAGDVPAAGPEDEGGLLTFGKSTIGGIGQSLAGLPGGLSALGEYIGGYDIGSTDFGKSAQKWSNEAQQTVSEKFDMNDSVSSKAGQTVGSLLSFFIPGTAVAKGASLLGAGARLAGGAALGTMATQGSALSAQDQLNRMANFIENGGEIDEETKRSAVALSGLLGTTEALPFGPMFRTLGSVMKILKKVPANKSDEALRTIGGRLKRSFKAGLGEGSQEALAGIAQDLIEKNLYNDDLKVGQSAYDDAVYGGGAGAALNLIIDSVRGRQLNKIDKKASQLDDDLKKANAEALQKQKNYENYAASLKPMLLLAPPEQVGSSIPQEQLQIEGPSQKIEKIITPKAIEDLRTRGQKSASATMAAARETTQPLTNVSLENLPKEEALRIAQRRQMLGADPSADVSIDELRSVIGNESAERETSIQKPILTKQDNTGYTISGREIEITEQEISSLNKDAAIVVEDLVVKGKLNKATLKKALQNSFSGTNIKVTNEDVNSYLQGLEEEGIILINNKGQYVKATEQALSAKAKAEAIKQRGKEILNLQNKAVSEEELDNLAQEYLALKKEADAIERATNKSTTDKAEQVDADKIIPEYTAKRSSDQAAKSPYTDAYKLKLTSVLNNLKAQLNDMGLGDINLEGKSIIQNQEGVDDAGIEGSFGSTASGKRIIALAMDIYDPNLSEAQLTKKLSGILNHEIIHALVDIGAITDTEYLILVKAAMKRKYVAEENGKFVTKEYTYMERATSIYKDQEGMTPQGIEEEAVAEMFRDYADGKLKVVGKPKSLFDRIIRILKAIFTSNYNAGFTESNEIFANIKRTKTEQEIYKSQRTPKAARSFSKYSMAGVVAGYIQPRLGNIDRIKQSFKDVTARIEVLEKAAKRLQNNEIDYKTYDKLVNDVKPIVPYETVPAPETVTDMRNALQKNQVEKLNTIFKIPDGTQIQLRLDIPAYRDKGVWIPTIHGTLETDQLGLGKRNQAIAHESVAILNNANLLMSEGLQKTGLRIASGGAKGPYATISGNLEQTTPDAAFMEAQAALNDPTFVQIGFDPTRHSYFYDRTTTQPVIGAERIIQVGPLVMAKNPVFEGKQEFKYSNITVTRKSYPMSNPVTTVSDGTTNIYFTKNDVDGLFYRSTVDGMIILNPDGSDNYTSFPSLPYAFTRKESIEEATETLELINSLNQQNKKYSKTSSSLEGLENRLIGFIKDNPDGFTIDPDTFYIPSRGKAVAPVKAAEIVTRPELITPQLIRDFAKNVQIMTKIAGNVSLGNKVYAGGWLNKKTADNPEGDGLFYLDATMVIEDSRDALYTAEAGNQKAIFDLGEFYETVTKDGIQQLRENGTYSSDRRARIGRNIRQYSQEFVEARREDTSGQGIRYSRTNSSIDRARQEKDQYGRYLIESTIVNEYDKDGNIKVQPEYQTDPTKANLAVPNRVNKLDALANHQIKRGNVIYDIHAKDIIERKRNRENVSIMMAAEGQKALEQSNNAIGWYDRVLKLAKKAVALIHPEILTDPEANFAFDFALAVTSNGMGVVFNFKHAETQYAAWKASPDKRFPEMGWGERIPAMTSGFAFYNSMKKIGATTEEFIEFMDMQTTPKELRQNEFVKKAKIIVSSDESANTPVSGAYVIGAKIGHGFFQNLRGNYNNLTMDIWFMRAINRLTGSVFKKPPQQKTLDRNLERVLLALDGKKQDPKNGFDPSDNPLTDLDIELIERVQSDLGIDIINENNALIFSEQFVKEYQSFRKYFKSEEYQSGNMQFGKKIPPKSELQLSTETHYTNTTIREQDAPRGAADRQAMREIVNRAREILESDTGIKITNADFQALLWYAEKRLFAKQGVAKGTGDDNDYLDGAINLLKEKGFDNGEISDTLPEAERTRVYSRVGSYGGDGQVRRGDVDVITSEETGFQEEIDPDPYEGLSTEEKTRLEEEAIDYKFSRLTSPSSEANPVRIPLLGVAKNQVGIGGYKYKTQYTYGSPYVYGYAKSLNEKSHNIYLQEGTHSEIEGRKGKYQGFGLAHIFGERFDQSGVKLPTHADTIMKYHEANDVQELMFRMLDKYIRNESRQSAGRIINPINDFGITVYPDGGVGNNDLRIEWSNAPLAKLPLDLPNAEGKYPDGSTSTKDKYGRPYTRSNPKPEKKKPQERILVLSLKYDPKAFQRKIAPETKSIGNIFQLPKTEWVPIYSVRTFFSKPLNTQARQKLRYSKVSGNPAQTTSPNSSEILQDITDRRQKIRYDNLSGIIAKGLGYVMPEDQAKVKAQRVLTYFQDAMLPVGAMLDELRTNGYKITDAMDTYLQETVYQGVVGDKVTKVQEELFEPMMNVMDTLNINESKIQELKNIKGSGGSKGFYETVVDGYIGKKLAISDAVLYAFHAKQRNAYLRTKSNGKVQSGSGMTDQQADEIISWYNSLPQSEIAKLENIRDFAKKINESTIDQRIESGLLPADARDPNRAEPIIIYTDGSYVPLQGDSDIEVESLLDSTYGQKRTFTNFFGAAGKEDMRATGRSPIDDYAQNIIASMMAQNNNSIDRGERNKVGQSFNDLMNGLEEQDDGSTATNDSLAKEMNKIAEDVTDENVNLRRQRGIKPDNEFNFKVNGKQRTLHILDPRIAKAMNGSMTAQQTNGLVKMMGKLNRFLSAINTTYNPSFVIPNFFRDLETAGVNTEQYAEEGLTKEVIKGTPSAVYGIGRLLFDKNAQNEWTDIYKEYVSAGGKNATNQMGDVKDQIDNIKSILGDISDSGIKHKLGLNRNQFIGKNARSLLNILDNANTAVENGVRVSLYKSLRERGVSKIRAAEAARNITVNFAKGGENKVFMNSFYLFYNASLQGSMALANAAIKSPKVRKVWAGLFVYGIMQDMINGLFSGDEDEDGINDYDELPRHILEHSLIVPTFGLTGDKFVTIPLAYGLNMATNFGRALSRTARGEYTPGEATNSIVGTMVESISPIGAYDNFLNFVSPTVADPFISSAINKDYKGDPIYKESPTYASVQKTNSSQYWSNTSSIAKVIASSVNSLTGGDDIEKGFLDMSPDLIEFWFGTITGGTGRFVQRTFEAPVDIYDALQGDFEGSLTNSIPLVRKLISTPSPRADTGNYLDNRQDLFTVLAKLDLARRSGDVDAVRAMYENNKKELSIAGRMKAIDNARNRMQRQIKEIERNPRIAENVKKNIIKMRKDKINELQQRGLILMRSAGFKKAG